MNSGERLNELDGALKYAMAQSSLEEQRKKTDLKTLLLLAQQIHRPSKTQAEHDQDSTHDSKNQPATNS